MSLSEVCLDVVRDLMSDYDKAGRRTRRKATHRDQEDAAQQETIAEMRLDGAHKNEQTTPLSRHGSGGAITYRNPTAG
jgi:hypothetical protein